MEVRWKTLCTKTLIWLAAEIILNSMGLDTLADYSEFVFDKNSVIHLATSHKSYITANKLDDLGTVQKNNQARF